MLHCSITTYSLPHIPHLVQQNIGDSKTPFTSLHWYVSCTLSKKGMILTIIHALVRSRFDYHNVLDKSEPDNKTQFYTVHRS